MSEFAPMLPLISFVLVFFGVLALKRLLPGIR